MHRTGQAFTSKEPTLLNDALILMEISYLDSASNYRECVSNVSETPRPRSRTRKRKLAEYISVAIILLIGIAAGFAVWFLA